MTTTMANGNRIPIKDNGNGSHQRQPPLKPPLLKPAMLRNLSVATTKLSAVSSIVILDYAEFQNFFFGFRFHQLGMVSTRHWKVQT